MTTKRFLILLAVAALAVNVYAQYAVPTWSPITMTSHLWARNNPDVLPCSMRDGFMCALSQRTTMNEDNAARLYQALVAVRNDNPAAFDAHLAAYGVEMIVTGAK